MDEMKQFPSREVHTQQKTMMRSSVEYSMTTITDIIHVSSNIFIDKAMDINILLLVQKDGRVEIRGNQHVHLISLPEISHVLTSKIKYTGRRTDNFYNGYIIFMDTNNVYHIVIFNYQTHTIIALNWPDGLSTSMMKRRVSVKSSRF